MDALEFKRVFLPCHRRLYGLAFRIMADAARAEDMVQDTYMRLWERRDELAHVENCEAYCMTVLRNVCLDALRGDSASGITQDMVPDIADQYDTAAAVEVRDELRQLRALIDRLPKNQSDVVRLRDICGCSFDEIRQLTGLGDVNIRVLLSRARKTLRKQFKNIINYGC